MRYLRSRVTANAAKTLELLGATSIESVIVEDLPVLTTILEQTAENRTDIVFIEIQDRDQKSLVKWIRPEYQERNSENILTSSMPITLDDLKLGSIHLKQDLSSGLKDIKRHVNEIRTWVTALLGFLSVSLLAALHFIVVLPVKSITQRLEEDDASCEISKSTAVRSQEFKYLDDAVSAHLQAKRDLVHARQQTEEANAKINEINANLEETVQRRTHELTIKSDELSRSLEELKELQTQLVAQEKLASLGALSAGIAHEIKNPINLINGSAEIIVECAKDSLPEQLEILKKDFSEENIADFVEEIDVLRDTSDIIMNNAKRADRIVKSMLQQSRSENAELAQVNLKTIVEDSYKLAYHSMRATSPFDLTEIIELEDVAELRACGADLERALINVFDNAFYALRDKKNRVDGDYRPELLVSLAATEDDCVEIVVRDNGMGIPQDVKDRILQPFFTTKPTGEGTGLGLSMVNDVVVAHRGRFVIDSEENEYTAMKMLIPMNPETGA